MTQPDDPTTTGTQAESARNSLYIRRTSTMHEEEFGGEVVWMVRLSQK